jgi:selenide,water dikinase
LDATLIDILSDAQTSGGLLISVPSEKANLLTEKLIEKKTPVTKIVGEVLKKPEGTIQVR